MGIRTLTKFVDTNYARWERGRRVRGTLVVDGNCILHSLHTMEWSNGGQYREFRNAVRRFYSKLLESGISPIVVFDGVDEAQKIDTLVRRKQEWVNTIHNRITDNSSRPAKTHGRILPPLTSEVYRMALYGLDIQFYVADAEADVAIARLANHYHCPVLSQDSDFFVFRLVGGFIHFKRFYYYSSVVTADVYHRDQFADQLGLRDRSLFCVIPAIVGNDFMEPCVPSFISQMVRSISTTGSASSRIRAICSHLSHFSSVGDFTSRSYGGKKLEQRCQRALEWYEVPKDLSVEELVSSTDLSHHNGTKFPEWLTRLFHLGHLPSSPMDAAISSQAIFRVVAENFKKENSVLAGLPIRQHMYALLEVDTVVEILRCGLTMEGVKVMKQELNGEFRGVTLASVEFFSYQERQSLFYEILKCHKLTINLKLTGRYQDWRFVAATTSFWARTTHPPEHLVRALLLCFMLCSFLPEARFKLLHSHSWKVPLEFRQSQEWLDTLHWFSQWQAIYHTAFTLNALLNEPMWVFSPAFLYDGQLAMHLASTTDTSQWQYEVDVDLYNRLEEIVVGTEPLTPLFITKNTLSSSDTESMSDVAQDEAVNCDEVSEDAKVQTTSPDSVEGHQGEQRTPSSRVNSTKAQKVAEQQIQQTTCGNPADEQKGVGNTQKATPQLKYNKAQAVSKQVVIERTGEQEVNVGEIENCEATPSILLGSEAPATSVSQEPTARSGTTKVKRKRKRSRQKKVLSNNGIKGIAECINGETTNAPEHHPSKGLPLTQTSQKNTAAEDPSVLLSTRESLTTATSSFSGTATANPTSSEAKRKRKRSKQKKIKPAEEVGEQEGESGNSNKPPEVLSTEGTAASLSAAGIQESVSVNVASVVCFSGLGTGATALIGKPEQTRIQQGKQTCADNGKSPKRPSSITSPNRASEKCNNAVAVQTKPQEEAEGSILQKPAMHTGERAKPAETTTLSQPASASEKSSCGPATVKPTKKRYRNRSAKKEVETHTGIHCWPSPVVSTTSSSAQLTVGKSQHAQTTTKSEPQKGSGSSMKGKQTLHMPLQQSSRPLPAVNASQKLVSRGAKAGKAHSPHGNKSSQISPMVTHQPPQVLQGSRQPLRAGPNSAGTTQVPQGPIQQPLTQDGQPANPKRRRNRRRPRTQPKAQPAEAPTANTT